MAVPVGGERRIQQAPTDALALAQGTLNFQTPDFTLKLVKSSQTVAALQPKGAGGFDFTPADRLAIRSSNGFHHLGDLTLRVRRGTSGEWQEVDTARSRKPVIQLRAAGSALASADLAPTIPEGAPLKVTREWAVESGRLVLRFKLTNPGTAPVQIGGLGIPVPFNNIITGRDLKQAHEVCSFADPYMGQDGGYLQVTRLSGKGPALVVVPEGKTPFEAYAPLSEPLPPNQTFEGVFAWMAHTQAFADNEWKATQPWNVPTMETVAPGATRTFGLRFLLADEIRGIDRALESNGRPVAVGIPGYVLPMDIDGKLFVKHAPAVRSVDSEPADALSITAGGTTPHGWRAYTVRGRKWGRARLTLTYRDGTRQTVHYVVIKPAAQVVSDLGRFLFTRQWFNDSSDPFGRAPSVMSYDREKDRIVTQDSRVWISGLGDEGGSGSWLAAAMKLFAQPDPKQIAQYERFVDNVLWGRIQFKDGPTTYGVRKSVFFYDPREMPNYLYDPALNWRSWTSWNKRASEDIGRGYNYPHVVAAYWSMYRVARNSVGLVRNHPWSWYLNQAYETTKFTFSRDPRGYRRVGWVELGLMEGDIFLAVLEDLKREGWADKAAEIGTLMKERADRWSHEEFPFGSEMAWDSTGQEEVYAWCRHFGFDDKALVSLNAILGYMPTVPHWGYNGNARRYWDFLYGGKLSRIERQIHHYGSGLNAIPVLTAYRDNPDDFYLLRVGYGGVMGPLTNIDQEGFASAAFHSFPSTLKWDAYSGDYGPNFFGHALNSGTYIVNHPEFGWQAFGGNVRRSGNRVNVKTLDSLRQRVYVAPKGLWLTLDSGRFESIDLDNAGNRFRIALAPGTPQEPQARLRIETLIKAGTAYKPVGAWKTDGGAYVIPMGKRTTWVDMAPAGAYR